MGKATECMHKETKLIAPLGVHLSNIIAACTLDKTLPCGYRLPKDHLKRK